MERFNFTMGPQKYTVPAGVNFLQVDACGARGGTGGYGGFISGIVPVVPGQLLWIYVGGGFDGIAVEGQPSKSKNYFGYYANPTATFAFIKGYNGGGYGGYTNLGGGGTDIRADYGGSDGSQNVLSRLVVAGGGGGYLYGGAGGGIIGQAGKNLQQLQFNGQGGSQGGGGLGSTGCTYFQKSKNGALWQGGACVNDYDGGGAGGGGGYYGGGAGGSQFGNAGGGGGGSSYFTPTGNLLKSAQGQCLGPHGSLNITALVNPPLVTTDQDSDKLCSFFRALLSFPSLTGWCTGPGPYDPCSGTWTGVGCATVNGVLRVTSLQLSGKGLAGGLSASLGGLGALTSLNISHNSLGGSLPSELGALTGLQTLALNGNKFTGPVPFSLCRLSSSVSLAIQSNPSLICLPPCLLTTFPKLQKDTDFKQCGSAADDGKVICKFPQKYLWPSCFGPGPYDPCSGWNYVSCSKVSGVMRVTSYSQLYSYTPNDPYPNLAGLDALKVFEAMVFQTPPGLESLASLESLKLRAVIQGQGFLTLPYSIGNLRLLTSLDLSASSWGGSLPSSIWTLTNLKYVSLSQTKFTGELSPLIGSWTSLTYLDLSSTSMGGTIPSTLFSLTNLKTLMLSNNRFTGQQLPTYIGQLKNLNILYLQQIGLAGTIPSEIGSMSALSKLYLYANSLTGTLPTMLGQLRQLNSLVLNLNQLSGIVPSQICTLPIGCYLNLRGNKIACVPKCLNTTRFTSGLEMDIVGVCTLAPTPFPTLFPSMAPTGYTTEFQRQTTLSKFTVTQTFTCIGDASICVSVSLYAPVLQSVNNELWMAFADKETNWLTADMLAASVVVSFNPNIGSDLRGYLLSYDYSFRPSDLKMSSMMAVQTSFKKAVAAIGVSAYTEALNTARKSSGSALSDLTTLSCTSIDVSEASPAPPKAGSSTVALESQLLKVMASAPVELGFGAILAFFFSLLVYVLRNGVQRQNEGVVVAFKHFEFFIPLVLSISAATSNILQIRTYLVSPATTGIAAVMIVCRMGVGLYSTALLTMSLFRTSYRKHMVGFLLHKGLLWVLVAFAALLDPTHLRYFPWKNSEFSERSRGFPTLHFFKVAMGCTAANSLMQLSVSVVKGVSFSAIASLALNLVLFVSTIFTIVVKLVAEKIHEHDLTLLPVAASLEGALKIIAGKDNEIATLKEEIAKLRSKIGLRPSTGDQGGIAMVPLATSPPKRLTAFVNFSDVYNPAHPDISSSTAIGSSSMEVLEALRRE